MSEGAGARLYHEQTKHSPLGIRRSPHFLDWDNQPLPFKIYEGAETVRLPALQDSDGERGTPALSALCGPAKSPRSVDAETLSKLLFYTGGITKRLRLGGGEMPFRAAACTGALYHVELYLVTDAVDGLEAGVYHYDPRENALDRLRAGGFRQVLVEATGGEAATECSPAVLVLTTTYWRNAWKYRARAYRHAFWDSGTMLANLFAVGAAAGTEIRLVLGFADEEVHELLGVDSQKESAVALVAISPGSAAVPPGPSTKPPPLDLTTLPLSRSEVDYAEIREMQRASSLSSGEAARAWRGGGALPATGSRHPSSDVRFLDPFGDGERLSDPLGRVIRKRGSARRFQRTTIDFRELSTILAASTRGVGSDALPPEGLLSQPYVIVNDVRGLPSGAYVHHPPSSALQLLRAGDLRERARFLDLEQDLAGDAAANVYLLVDLDPLLERYGDRGYRLAQLEGGLAGGRIYLAAYALGLGATGLTFYDDEVTEFFSPHAAGKSVMFLAALGHPARRSVLFQK